MTTTCGYDRDRMAPSPPPGATGATADLAPDSGYESQGYKFATTINTPTIRPAIPR